MLNPAASSRLRVNARRNVIDTAHALVTISQLGVGSNLMTLEEVRSIPLISLLLYGGQKNSYDARWPVAYMNPREDPVSLTQLAPFSHQEWLDYWRGKDKGARLSRFNPAVGFGGYHPDLLLISGAKELQPHLDGNLPPQHIGYSIDLVGPGEGYLGVLNQTRDESSATGETQPSDESD